MRCGWRALAGPLAGLLPRRLRNLIALAAGRPAAGEILSPGIYPADGMRKMRVALLPSCAQQALDRNINAATMRLLQRHGCEVVVTPGVGCCGALPLHMGRDAQGKALARANVAAWSAELANGLDAIVINASGCGTTVKDYAHLVGGEHGAPHRRACARRHRASCRSLACRKAMPSHIASPITTPVRCSMVSAS